MKKDLMDFPTEIIREGETKILVPKLEAFKNSPSDYLPSKAPVFYNPVMENNRDLTILAFEVYKKKLKREISICEPLTGSGIRGIRFATELKDVKVIINDLNKNAYKMAEYNILMNQLDNLITVKNQEANFLLNSYSAPKKRFDIIDIDPFGSPVPYLDSALRALRDGGLLALTATDMSNLCGVYQKACIRKYGGKPLRTEYCHELAIRILAGCLAATAAKYEIGVKIIFSYNKDHYIRIYAKIKYGAKKADLNIKNLGYILHCFNCLHREIHKSKTLIDVSKRCKYCNSELDFAGPLWLGNIIDNNFCILMKEELKIRKFRYERAEEKMLCLLKNEEKAPITYYVTDKLCDKLNLPVPSLKKLVENLKKEDYKVYFTNFNPKGLKTNAPIFKVKEILRKTLTQ